MKDPMHTDLRAEAYYLTDLQHTLNEYDDFLIWCEGTQKRGYSREVVGVAEFRGMRNNRIIDFLGLEVSRNGIYHLLPESLFIPFTLGKAASNTYEIVEEVKKNRQRESAAKKFFAPIDTELFLWKVLLLRRYLGWPNTEDRQLISSIAEILAGQSLELDSDVVPLWLSLLTENQQAKENLEMLETYLQLMLKREVKMQEVELPVPQSPYVALGKTRLAVDSVLAGFPPSEISDWQVEIELYEPEIQREVTEHKIEQLVRSILEYFALACRRILIRFKPRLNESSQLLSEGTLGMNTYLLN